MIKINSDWLLVWFNTELLRSEEIQKYYNLLDHNNNNNKIAKLKYLHQLTVFTLLSLHIIENPETSLLPRLIFTSPEDPVTPALAQIGLIAEYSYIVLGLNREINIEEHLIQLITPQLLHYSSKEAYRDHLFHIIDVCLLGHVFLLLEIDNPKNSNPFPCWLTSGINNENRQNYIKLWYFTALFHDIGYTLGISQHINEYLEMLSSPEIDSYKNEYNEGLKTAIKSFDEKLKENIPVCSSMILKGESGAKDHAIVSMVHTLQLLREIKKEEAFIKSFEECLIAIFLHEGYSREINVKEMPIAFLLLLCDRLQEWGRPRLQIDDISQKFISTLRFDEPFYPETYNTAQFLCINLNIELNISEFPKQSNWNVTINHPNTDTLLCYLIHDAADSKESAEVVPGWVKLYSDFQKLIYLDCLNIEKIIISSFHPRSIQLNKFSWYVTEMELLRAYSAFTSEGGYLFEWKNQIQFVSNPDNPIGASALQYFENNDDNNYEQMFITIKNWGNPKKGIPKWIAHLPSSYYSDFCKWKREMLINEKI
jgi:hypothetical protein